MRKGVLIITSPFRPNIGGVETHLDDLIKAGSKRKIDFAVVTYQPLVTPAKGPYKEQGDNYTVYRIPWPRLNLFLRLEKMPALEFLYLFPGIFLGGLVYLFFNKKRINVIHSQGLVAGAAGILLGLLFKKKVLVSTHSIYNFPKKGFYRKFVKFIFGHSVNILTLSHQSKREILELGIPESRVHRFTYWVDQKMFSPKDKTLARREIGITKNNFVCLFVGRLVLVKGIRVLLDAAKDTDKNILFVVAGSGPLETEVASFSSHHKNVLYVGPIDNSRLPLYYSASDIVIIPSVHEEGFGRVILESLSCGTPVVGAKMGAIPEAIGKEVGILIDATSENVTKTLEILHKSPQRLKTLAKNARYFARKNFSEKNVNQIFRHYA